MKDEELLNAVFRFKHKTPSDNQDAATCVTLANWFAAFTDKLEAVEVPEHKCGRVEPLADDRVVPASDFSVHEVEILQQVSQRLTAAAGKHKRGDMWYDPWLPMYGCVLQRTMLNATTVKLEVIFVDGWERTLHFLPGGECVHSAVPKTHHVLHCADLDTELEVKFGTAFASELQNAKLRRGSDRSASRNELGHQKTPQFIAAAVRRAVSAVMQGNSIDSIDCTARGGTTDVGQHTGGQARDTCWALVQAVVAQNLCCGRGLFRKAMVTIEMKLLQMAVQVAENLFCAEDINLRDGCASVDDMFYMLQVIVLHTINLLEGGYEVSMFQKKCTELRSSIAGFVDFMNHQSAARYILPEAVLQRLNELECGVEVDSPRRIKPENLEDSNTCHDRAWANLEGCCFLDGSSCSLNKLLQWMKSNTSPASYKRILIMRTVETFMYTKSRRLCERVTDSKPLSMERMQALVTEYQAITRQWRQHPNMTSVLDVEHRSRETLVLWIAFCLVHRQCVDEVPLCSQYNIALDWKELKVLVLSDRAAISALQNVTRYIRGWNNNVHGPQLFHLSNQDPTFNFAQTYGLGNSSMCAIYDLEVRIWEAHLRKKWSEIERKKREAADLRDEIVRLNASLVETQNALANEEKRLRLEYLSWGYSSGSRRSRAKTRLTNEVERISSVIKRKEGELRSTIAVPPYLVRPVPPAKNDAIQVIFMLMMPRNLEILGSLCLTAQRALAPVGATSEMMTLPKLSPTTWQQLYYQHAPSRALTATANMFTPTPAPFSLPSSWGPSTIDELYNLAQYTSECVWDPSLYGTALTWMDVSGAKLNPFNATEISVIDSFIERLPLTYRQLQWMNAWPADGDTRGNLVYANLHQQLEGFEKASFIALGSLRAFPNQQYRKLQWALLEDALPWTHQCVEIIVRQSLYQAGTLTDEDKPSLLWKTDLFRNERGLETFCSMLEIVASKLEQTPRNFEMVPLLSELAGFLFQFTRNARQLVGLFSGMVRRWAKDASLEYEKESSPHQIAAIRQKESILYGYALLAYTLGPWYNNASQEVCELLVQFRKAFLCASVTLKCTDQMLRVESKIEEMMARRISELVEYANMSGADTILTGLVRLASATSPNRLIWNQFRDLTLSNGQFGSCFEAFDGPSNTHYSVNLFTGIVLTNGYAPGGLPAEIRNHERFKSLFGRSNFEVFCTNGVLRTERKFCDRLYDFALLANGDLFVQELTEHSGVITRTLQLCSAKWVKTLAEMFPVRLIELYSHWYWAEKNCVFFRPQTAKHREVYFAATLNWEDVLECYSIPFSDTKCPYAEILNRLGGLDQFVRTDEYLLKVFNVLTKFEEKKFFHPLKSTLGVLKIELPRFKLTFLLNSGLQLESVEHKGYILAQRQQFDDFLPRFSRYLLLELKDKSDTSRPELRMLLPVGAVVDSSENIVYVRISNEADSTIDIACFDVHRRLKTFEAETISARLQLAAVCVRAGTNVPSDRLEMTGSEAALQILRACRSSRPFSTVERNNLLSVYELSYREPAIKMLAVALLTESNRLGFLFGKTQTINAAMGSTDEKAEYADMIAERIQRNPLRSQFRYNEEKRFLGRMQHDSVLSLGSEVVSCEGPPVPGNYVKSIEKELACFVTAGGTSNRVVLPLPLKSATTNTMGRSMLEELKVSWESYHSQVQVELRAAPDAFLESFLEFLNDVASRRYKTEMYLWDVIAKATSSTRDGLLHVANYLPVPTVADIVQCAFDNETLHTLCPKLSEKSRELFKKGILQYMELCVLEDKVERLIWKAKRSDAMSTAQLVDELINERQWSSTEYPYWLAFEVEGRLQIRHEQFVIAQHLIDRPGTVCQLNMGRGKTRVILPMLFLYFTRNQCPRVIRAHFLSPLLTEAGQYMHRYLSASNARLGIFEQPFHRQIDLDTRRLEFIRDAFEELKIYGGIQMVAPEHRMSLELKRLELSKDGASAKILTEILESDQFVDVLDECDALLNHKYHLVYAVGIPIQLCNGIERWQAAESLLCAIADTSLGSRVAKVLQAPHVACTSPDYATRLGAYDGTRLNTVVERTRLLREQLKKKLVLDLIDNPLFEFMWLNKFGTGNARESLVAAIIDPDVSLQEALGDFMGKLASYTNQLLALRGLIAFGVFEHCMEKRYRVDFGIPAPGTRPKKIAIPFRAADVPSERSEFSHPDVCIVLTLLGYYHGGLTDSEVRNAFRMLLRLDISEQDQQYDRWYLSVKPGLSDEDQKALCNVRHISLADTRQFETLCRVYKFCMEAINFYLNTCVFPNDTQQYPQRLSRTAWNLAAGSNNIGFSGTNDNHRLLPLSVTQEEPNEPSLLGTNGKMIDKILQVTHSYEVIRPSSQSSPIPWESVLLFAINKRAQALIDTGALLAGVTNHDAAVFLLEQAEFNYAGVTYYDSREEYNCWVIAEKARRVKMPLKKAAMLEKETFVIFDEARSRGSDMKLLPDAVAVLTLGPKLTKDKLMQGAGRMRQLGCNQSLWITSFDEVAQSIFQTSGKLRTADLTALDVLNWVMDNTKTEAVRGLLEWAGNGIHFRKTQISQAAELVDDNWALETLYQEKLRIDKIAEVIKSKAHFDFKEVTDAMVSKICQRGFVYGLDDEVYVTSHTDECERELQVEEEVQQMQEVQVMKYSPEEEKTWNYRKILRAKSVTSLTGVVRVLDMTQFSRQSIFPKELSNLSWANARIFGTENFFATIIARNGLDRMNEFLRVVDVVLVFKNGDVLLVSECEADHILELIWSVGDVNSYSFCFVNLAFACESIDRVGAHTTLHDAHLVVGSGLKALPMLSVLACHVFNGETMVAKHQRAIVETPFREFLRPLRQRETTLSNFVISRGNSYKWTRSFLHELCCRMDLEDCQ